MAKKVNKVSTPPLTEKENLQQVFNEIWRHNVQMGAAYHLQEKDRKYVVTGPVAVKKTDKKLSELNNLYIRAVKNTTQLLTPRRSPYSRDQLRIWRKTIKNNLIYYAVKHGLSVPTDRDTTGQSVKF